MITKRKTAIILSIILVIALQSNASNYHVPFVVNDTNLVQDTIFNVESSNFIVPLQEESDSAYFKLVDSITLNQRLDSLTSLPMQRKDTLLFAANPLALPLVFIGKDIQQVWNDRITYKKFSRDPKGFQLMDFSTNLSSEQLVKKLRDDARIYLANNHLSLYSYNVSDLPDADKYKYNLLQHAEIHTINMGNVKLNIDSHQIDVEKAKPLYWLKRANAMLQFSQNYQTPNWHKGGNNNIASLASFVGELNYDNLKDKKNVIWENKVEWRAGFYSVEGDTLRKVAVNEDILRYTTKFGVKAGGNWYYSLSGEVNTLLFDNFKGINSKEYKARFLTPVRTNVGIGMNYKYKKLFSLMFAPLSFKYIYVNDTVNVNPNSFGIEKGKNQLKQFGSSLNTQLKYSFAQNWDISSRFTFYTNYEKVEIDWEIVNNFIINRFLSARLLLHPRYDNTVILKKGEKARIQFKEYMSLGFSVRLI